MNDAIISAKDIVPGAFKNEMDDDISDVDENREDVVDDLSYDVFNLLACNYHAIRITNTDDREQILQSQAQRVAQLLMKK